MRAALLALFTLISPVASAYEIEDRTLFAATGATADVTLKVLSTADTDVFAPILRSFQADNPSVAVDYITVSSAEIMVAVVEEQEAFDLVISSAMDLQIKLSNDGYAQPHRSSATQALPDWAAWREEVFGFTREPASIVLSRAAFDGLDLPRTRPDLIRILRENPDRFRGRIGTYDIRQSGLGYLFATQDSRNSETFWRLSETLGSLGTRLYCCSGAMIDDVEEGELAIAYNVLGSYATARLDGGDSSVIVLPQDYVTLMLRSALIPANAAHPDTAGALVDHLITDALGDDLPDRPFPALLPMGQDAATAPSPIRLGPGLLVFLDRLRRENFIRAWEASMLQ
ncbi:ABC transporter substrate-binding protein [Pontivivens insulae]|uniref:ABC transporter substrate-binding protein n=1 Tax=Pontivivens insulae TaxID=1639689 RepID=A0A2R8ADA3_9RHOB|nr:ABC transporter substrate-binding protein [Pontivivens insulae]RED13976.1 iron(III) transport system substrate-binding protein [Pontivivens insulae]SPF30050.1 hypothetical protein POI8812_02379 [Pontivivens insulae]